MKGRICLLLALLMCFSMCPPAQALDGKEELSGFSVTAYETTTTSGARIQDVVQYTESIEDALTDNVLSIVGGLVIVR